MKKFCASSISKTLHLIFRNCVETKSFPKELKKANITPVHKNGDKQLVANYRPVSLLLICRKVFEKIILNSLFVYLNNNNNNLLNSNKPRFRPGDSYVHQYRRKKKCDQLISITHDIYKAFDADPSLEVKGVFLFLDLSKAFDKVWDDGLFYELRRMGICGRYFELIHSFLSDGFQRSFSKWPKFKMVTNYSWCSAMFSLRTLIILSLYI